MRAVVLLVLLCPTVSAWSVQVAAPEAAVEGAAFPVEVCAQTPGRAQVRVIAANATLGIREDRYLPAFEERACHAFLAEPAGGRVEIEARVRAEGGSTVKARAFANVTISPAPGEVSILEAWAPPFEGVLLHNVGDAPAPLALRRLGGVLLPDADLAPGELAFLGREAPPLDARHVPHDVRVRNATLRLTVGDRVESEIVVPKLKDGHSTAGRYGRSALGSPSFDLTGEILAFSTPGATPIPALIDAAREEVLVAAHTMTSADVAAALAGAADRGARVRVLLEGAPPGGIPDAERALAAALRARGVEVLAMEGAHARYRTMHAKLVVVDREVAVVSTENLNEGSSRGFGLVVRDPTLAATIADLMDADAARGWRDVHPLRADVAPATLARSLREPGEIARVEGPHAARLVLSPDDPRVLADAVAGARVSLDVAMLRADPESPMVDALIEAARAGARVRLALDARHDDGTNEALVARLDALAAREGLAIDARLADPARTLHAKTLVVDGRVSYVGSMNWVRAAWEENREAGLLVESGSLAAWLAQEIGKEWEEEGEPARLEVPAPGWIALAAAISGLCRRVPRGPA